MNKKRFLFIVLAISVNYFLSAQNLDFKSYSDSTTGYSGVALAVYLEEALIEVVETEFRLKGREIEKLTKENVWLCWEALGEWDIKDGETYFIMCADNEDTDTAIIIIATIKNGGESFDWWGRVVSEGDF